MPSFLNLPAEIRCLIYSYTVCPDITPITEFNGLYTSCRQIKHETDVECAKYLRPYLQEAHPRTFWPQANTGIRFGIPDTFIAMRNPHVSVATEPRSRKRCFSFFWPLLELHLDSLTIAFCKDNGSLDNDAEYVRWLDEHFDGPIGAYRDIADVGRVIFDLVHEDGS
jgi:hypothetical protein